jgi:hypothetical protein
MIIRSTFLMALLASALCLFAGCTKAGSQKSEMKFHKLTRAEEEQLARQRMLVLTTARSRYGTTKFTRTKSDLAVLQRLIDDRAFDKTQTLELQSLGVVFGDVLATELGLHWELVTDDYGTDPVLRYGTAQVQVAALTMISKRVEDGKEIDLTGLVEGVRKTLKEMKESGDYE